MSERGCTVEWKGAALACSQRRSGVHATVEGLQHINNTPIDWRLLNSAPFFLPRPLAPFLSSYYYRYTAPTCRSLSARVEWALSQSPNRFPAMNSGWAAGFWISAQNPAARDQRPRDSHAAPTWLVSLPLTVRIYVYVGLTPRAFYTRI